MSRIIPKLLFPIFAPVTLAVWAMLSIEAQSFDWNQVRGTGPSNSGMIYLIGAVITVPMAGFLQLTLGLGTLRLFREVTKFWKFVVLGTTPGFGLALFCLWAFREPNGRQHFELLPSLLGGIIPPLMIGYSLAFYFECHKAARNAIGRAKGGL